MPVSFIRPMPIASLARQLRMVLSLVMPHGRRAVRLPVELGRAQLPSSCPESLFVSRKQCSLTLDTSGVGDAREMVGVYLAFMDQRVP